MNEKQAFNRFTTFETANSVFTNSYNGVYYWDRIRCQVFSEILEKMGVWSTNKYSLESKDTERNLIEAGITRGIDSLRSLQDNPLFVGNRDVLFAAANTSRRERINGAYWDVLVDPLADRINYSYTSLENKSKIRKQCDGNIQTSDTAATDQLQFISGVGETLGPSETIEGSKANEMRVLEREISSIFDVEIDLIGRVEKELTRRKYTKPLYERIVKKIDPKMVIIRYNPSKSTLIEVCNAFSIPVIELQHGVDFEHKADISYDTPIDGELCFPDIYFSWGKYWSDKPNFPIDDVRIVGWPFLEYVSKEFINNGSSEGVLFISQPDCGKELSKIAVEISEATDWDVIYRLHPKERSNWESVYPWLESQDIRVDCGDKALYKVMDRCWAQIGTESTALYEGLNFDLSTFIFKEFDPETHPWNEIDGIYVFSNSNDLESRLRKQDLPDVDSNRFFESNSIKNIKAEIRDIISAK